MSYKENVSRLARKRGVWNPPLLGLWEPSIGIRELKIWDKASTGFIRISAERWNRAVRLFLEDILASQTEPRMEVITGTDFKTALVRTETFFAERWEVDSGDDLSNLIYHLKGADALQLGWK